MEFQHVELLTSELMDEAFKALGIKPSCAFSRFISPLLRMPARRFSEIACEFDQRVANEGLPAAARWVLPKFIRRISYYGHEKIPQKGPLLVVSNHPGTVDGLCIAAAMERTDIHIIASGIPFLRSLPATADHLICTTTDPYERMGVVRSALRHLKQEGALLLFPSGHIDPDPEIQDGAETSLLEWSPSVELILRKIPQIQVMVTIVRGVLSRGSLQNPLTLLRRLPRDRQRIAEFIQVIWQLVLQYQPKVMPKVNFSYPLSLSWLIREAKGANLLPVLIGKAKTMMYAPILP